MTCFSADDFLQLLQNLFPPGIAFPRAPDTVQTDFLKALSDVQGATAERQCNLLVDAFPATTVELLPEWEASLGLPDPCWGPDVTLEQRQAAVLARLLADGGQSIPYFIQFCTNLGFPGTTFKEFNAFRCGMYVGQPLYGIDWNYALQVNNPTLKAYYFQTGIDTTGTPLSWWTDSALICELRRVLPGHVVVIFNFIKVFRIPDDGEIDVPSFPNDWSEWAWEAG